MGTEVYVVLAVIVLLFGGSQLPKLARSLGQAKREFETGQSDAPESSKSKTDVKDAEAGDAQA